MMKRKYLIFLLLIIVMAFLVRVYRIQDTTAWEADQARDYLTGYHIAKFNEFPVVGHVAGGNKFYYPPYYYYFISLLVKLYESPLFVASFFSLLNALSVVTIYHIGKEIDEPITGLMAAGFFAFSDFGIETGRHIFSTYFAINIFFPSFLLLILYIKKRSLSLLLLGIFFLILSSTVSYVFFILVPIYIVASFYGKGSRLRSFLLCLLSALILIILLYLPLINYFGFNQFVRGLFFSQNIYLKQITLAKVLDNFNLFVTTLFGEMNNRVNYILVLAPFLYLAYRDKRKLRYHLFLLFLIIYVFCLSLFKPQTLFFHYYTVAYLMYFFIASLFITDILVRNKNRLDIKILSIVLIIFFGVRLNQNFFFLNYDYQGYRKTELVAEKIIAEAKQQKQKNNYTNFNFFQTYVKTQNGSIWGSAVIWYFLEKKLNQRMVKIKNEELGFEQTSSNKFIFLVCREYYQIDLEKFCLQSFLRKHANYKLVKNIGHFPPDKIFFLTKIR